MFEIMGRQKSVQIDLYWIEFCRSISPILDRINTVFAISTTGRFRLFLTLLLLPLESDLDKQEFPRSSQLYFVQE